MFLILYRFFSDFKSLKVAKLPLPLSLQMWFSEIYR